MIINWAGNIASPPSGWLVCDGSSKLVSAYGSLHTAIGYSFGGSGGNFNVPDMRDKFVIGAGSTYNVAATGGSADAIVVSHNHTFSGNTGNVGNHAHAWPNNENGARFTGVSNVQNGSGYAQGNGLLNANTTGQAGSHAHSFSGTTSTAGSSGTGANLPPYVAVGFIIKT